MAKTFPGFSRAAIDFFRQLARNNDRDWFAAHKAFYESEVRRPMIELVTQMCDEFRRFAPDFVPEKPEKVLYRIYRDTRFSKDKTPYKTHISAHFQHRQVPKNRGAGFYFEVSHEGLGVGGGMYMPEPEQLLAVRQTLEQQSKQFAKICEDRALVKCLGPLQGESAARVPKGFDPQSPAADWLRRKQLYFYAELDATVATTPRLYKEVMDRFKLTLPMMQFLNDAIIRAVGEEDSRPKRPEPMF